MDEQVLAVVFKLANLIVMPQWFMMIFFPNHKWTEWLLRTLAIPILLAILYVFFISFSMLYPSVEGGNFSSLEGVQKLFQSPVAVLAGWIHYLAFDLMVGRYIVQDSKLFAPNKYILGVCLFFTLMLGPAGLLGYLVYKKVNLK